MSRGLPHPSRFRQRSLYRKYSRCVYEPSCLSCFFEAVTVGVSWRRQLIIRDTKGRVIRSKTESSYALAWIS
jgi:hypothetical protein